MRYRRRNKKSKFDPYIKEIAALLDSGLSVRKVAEVIEPKMDDVVDDNALYVFIKSRGLRSYVTQGGTNKDFAVPHCRSCNECLSILNTKESDVMVCLKSKRMVSKTCQTSPIWCELRESKKGNVKQIINTK